MRKKAAVLLASVLFGAVGVAEQPHYATLADAVSVIDQSLVAHGNRSYSTNSATWTTRLNGVRDCYAELAVHSKFESQGTWQEDEIIQFSLAVLDAEEIKTDERWFEIHCRNADKCMNYFRNCKIEKQKGVVMDCSKPPAKISMMRILLDGTPGVTDTIAEAFRQSAEFCRAKPTVVF